MPSARDAGIASSVADARSADAGVASNGAAMPGTPSGEPDGEPNRARSVDVAPSVAPYRDIAKRILEASASDNAAWQKVADLADLAGARLSGSPALDRAIQWARDVFQHEGHENVSLEPVLVPHWIRGSESAELTAPIARALHILGLGGTVATPPGGITADVLVVASFDELEQRKADAAGKIVLLNHPMPRTADPGHDYSESYVYRGSGAVRAAPVAAVAVLVRSLTTTSMETPHTGAMTYGDAPKKIPAAAISLEDADLIARLAARGGPVKVHLSLGAHAAKDAPSANVIAEIRGREKPDEVVVLGAHIDSWDVGQGAQDDGAGCAIVMQSLTTLRRLNLIARRTIRVVLYTNEENGSRGAKQYAVDHRAELARHVAAFEVDTGSGVPLGVVTEGDPPFRDELRDVMTLLAPIGATTVIPAYAGSDIREMKSAGVPLFGLRLDMSTYFDVHHSAADTLDRVDPAHLQKSVAALATLAYVIADRESRWTMPPEAAPAPTPPPSKR
jgi:carboxypeptidase Q